MIYKKLCLFAVVLCFAVLSGAVRTFAQPLEPGDSDQDYDFDPYDIVLMQQAGKFGTGQPATWQEGDWDGAPGGTAGRPPAGDGVVTSVDIEAAAATGNYLKGFYADVKGDRLLGASDPILPGGAVEDDQTSIVYFNDTGVIVIDVPADRALAAILIESKSGIFSGDAANNVGANDFDVDEDARIFKTAFGGGFRTLNLGAVAATQRSEAFLLDDLSVSGALLGGGGIGPVDLVYSGEPLPDVQPGDADQDYDVDPYDIVQALQAGKFGTTQPATWEEGDWNAIGGPPGNPPVGDGFFNEIDLEIMLEAGRYREGPYGPQETPRGQGVRVLAGGVIGDDKVSIVYVAATGEVALDVPPGMELTSIVIDAESDLFTGLPPAGLGGLLDVGDDDRQIAKFTFGGGFSSLTFGRAAAPGERLGIMARVLAATGSRLGGGGLGVVDLVYLEEEPGFRRGDANADGHVDIGDAHLISHTQSFGSLSCYPAADVDDSGDVDSLDWLRLAMWLAGRSLAPSLPGPFVCGPDPGSEFVELGCRSYPVFLCGAPPERQQDARFAFRFDGVPETVGGGPGTTATFEVVVQICSERPVRAWSVGIAAGGDIEITGVRTEGTLAALAPDGLRNASGVASSFRAAVRAMSVVILGTSEPVDLPATVNGAGCEPRDVLILTVRATVPPDGSGVGSLEFVDGVDLTGAPIDNVVSYLDGAGAPQVASPQLEERTITVGSPLCPPNPVRCTDLAVSGPAGGGPGTYTAVMATADGGGSPLYTYRAENTATGQVIQRGVQEQSSASFELTEGEWTFSGSVTDGFRCVGNLCEEVTITVQCVEEPDSVSISGLAEAQVGSTVVVVATFQGQDPGTFVSFGWEIAAGQGELVASNGPVARVRSLVPGEVSVRVIAGDSLCQDVSVASHQIVFTEECQANAGVDCQRVTVTGPESGGPGEYVVSVAATFPAGAQPLYYYRVQNPATGQGTEAGPVPASSARVELPPGTWVFSAAAGVEPECPFDACSPVEVVVLCLEEPDAVAIAGPGEAQVGEVVELTASLSGADDGGAIAHAWEVISGAGEIVGAADSASVEVTAATGGEVRIRVRSRDGVCEDRAEAFHTILFQDCAPPGSFSCSGIEVDGPPGNVPGEYRITVAATVPANEDALYFYRIENPETGQSATAGPGPSSQVTATLPVGTWDIQVAVGTDADCPFIACAPVRVVVTETQVGEIGPFVRGDCNADQRLNLADAICVLDWLLLDGATPGCLAVANTNGDGDIDASDAIYLLVFLNSGGAEPVAPFPRCGLSSAAVDQVLGCESSPAYCR